MLSEGLLDKLWVWWEEETDREPIRRPQEGFWAEESGMRNWTEPCE